MKHGLLCPNCKSGELTKGGMFQTKTEAIDEIPSAVVAVDMMKCEGCNIQFPAVRGKKKYALVPEKQLSDLLEEKKEQENKNREIVAQVGAMELKQAGLREEIDKSRLAGDIGLLEAKIGSLESDNAALERKREKIEEVVNAIAQRSRLSVQGISPGTNAAN